MECNWGPGDRVVAITDRDAHWIVFAFNGCQDWPRLGRVYTIDRVVVCDCGTPALILREVPPTVTGIPTKWHWTDFKKVDPEQKSIDAIVAKMLKPPVPGPREVEPPVRVPEEVD